MEKSKNIGIVAYGCGNIRSLSNALIEIGIQYPKIIQSPSDLKQVTKIILPGVGAFDSGCKALKKSGLINPILDFLCIFRFPCVLISIYI